MSRLSYLRGEAHYVGLTVHTYSPGDGVTRYRFARPNVRDYFESNGLATVLGISAAEAWISAYRIGRDDGLTQAAELDTLEETF